MIAAVVIKLILKNDLDGLLFMRAETAGPIYAQGDTLHLNDIEIVPLYFAKPRPVVKFDGVDIMVDDDRMPLAADQKIQMKKVADDAER